MPAPVAIRPAVPDRDAEACAAIYAPHVTGSATSFEELAPGAPEVARRMAAAHAWLVADDGRGVAGFAYAAPHRERAGYRWTVETSVYVDATRQRAGVGRALYAELLPTLGDRGFRNALAGITLPNPASVALHEAVGFVAVGVYRRIGWKAGAWRDVGWWQCPLGPWDVDPPPSEPGA